MNEHDNNDTALRALLRTTAQEPPVDDVDWQRLHTRIVTRAQPLLRYGQQSLWWQTLAAWSARGVPIAASAAAALALLLGSGVVARRQTYVAPTIAADTTTPYVTVEEELRYLAADDDIALLLASTDEDALLDAVLFYEEGM